MRNEGFGGCSKLELSSKFQDGHASDKLGLGNGISSILTSLLDEMYIVDQWRIQHYRGSSALRRSNIDVQLFLSHSRTAWV